MSDTPKIPNSEERDSSREPVSDDLRELRRILVGPESEQLAALKEEIGDSGLRVQQVAEVLPKAIQLRSERNQRLSDSLQAIVEEILQNSVRRNPRMLAKALFPIMGPAIRASIVSTLREMLTGFERALNHSLSPRAIRWRIEAWQTKRPFSEVVLLKSIRYRVEQVFLIHRASGILLEHAVAADAPSSSPDMVSAMLTAIQDFVKDSFGVETEGGLDTLNVGELSIWLEQGPDAILAAVIRGNAPNQVRTQMRELLENVQLEFSDELSTFKGDVSPFGAVKSDLESCLQTELRETPSRTGPSLWAWGAIAVLVLFLSAFWLFTSWQDGNRVARFRTSLEAAPGIVVTAVTSRDGRLLVNGLRDPLATEIRELAARSGLDEQRIDDRTEPYYALVPEIIVARARQFLRAPTGVQLRLEGDVLVASGSVEAQWIETATQLAPALPGVARLESAGLVDSEQARARSIEARLESSSLVFSRDATLRTDQEDAVEQILTDLRELTDIARARGWRVRLRVTGITDEPGNDQINEIIGQNRARFFQNLLRSRGISEDVIDWELLHRRGSRRAIDFQMDLVEPANQQPR